MNLNIQNLEKELIKGCRKNDAAAQKILFEKYAPAMLGLCHRYIKNPHDAECMMITVSHLNLYLVPVYQFGKIKRAKSDKFPVICSDYDDRGFRVGAGGYVGHRLSSYTKLKYKEEDGDSEKSKNHENFFLENIRYGLRVQIGYKGTDLFMNYDLNNLFSENRGPELSAVSFGLMF